VSLHPDRILKKFLSHYDFSSETEFNAFTSKYSVQEDKIYNLWTEIQSEQAKLVVRPSKGLLKECDTPDPCFLGYPQ